MSTENSEIRASLGGSLRPGDARRFFIEAMVGAMHADGHVDRREMRALRAMLERHDLFAALSGEVAEMLIDLSADAIAFAGGAERRVPVICGNLRWRLDRLAAFAMACEVCAADEVLDERELRYLAALRIGLRLDAREHDALVAAARQGQSMAWLDRETARVRAQLPTLVELMLMRRWRGGAVDDEDARAIAELLPRLRDYGVSPADAETLVARVRPRAHRWSTRAEAVPLLLCELPFVCDRYWVMVAVLTDAMAAGLRRWVEDPLIRILAGAFHYSELQMQLAWDDASQLTAGFRRS